MARKRNKGKGKGGKTAPSRETFLRHQRRRIQRQPHPAEKSVDESIYTKPKSVVIVPPTDEQLQEMDISGYEELYDLGKKKAIEDSEWNRWPE